MASPGGDNQGLSFDTYSLWARVAPALLTLFPALATVGLTEPAVYADAKSVVLSLVLSCGVLFLLSEVARYFGRRVQIKLLSSWGGMPTTIWLRHRDASLDKNTKARYHKYLAEHARMSVPSEAEERTDPDAADGQYQSLTKWLLEQTRNPKKFPLVFKENVSYGFRRNLLGLKPWALTIHFSVLLGVAVSRYRATGTLDGRVLQDGHGVAIILTTVSLLVWIGVVTGAWVRDAGDAYARALLASCDAES